MKASIGFSGTVTYRVIRVPRADWRWRLENVFRKSYLKGWIYTRTARIFSKLTGIPTLTATLEATLIRHNKDRINYGILSQRVITDAGVAFLVDDWDNNATDITNMNYHASGTGTNAEAVGDTALQTEATTITDRATGTKSQPAANQLRTVGTQSYT